MRFLKPIVFSVSLLPALLLAVAAFQGRLGVNPVETINHVSGEWALRFLCITLAVTPLRKLTGWAFVMPLRRMLGLYSFFYAVIHVSTYLVFDLNLNLLALGRAIIKHNYILLGMAAFIILAALAATSTNGMIRRLGGARWRALHRLVYAAGLLAVLHFYWFKLGKNDTGEALIYGVILGVLLGYRVLDHFGKAPRLKRRR